MNIGYVPTSLRDVKFLFVIPVQILNSADKVKIIFDSKSFIPSAVESLADLEIRGFKNMDQLVSVDNVARQNSGTGIEPDSRPNEYKKLTVEFNLKRKIWRSLLRVVVQLFLIGIVSISLLYVRGIATE